MKLNVTSDSSLCVKFDAPDGSNGAVVTRYKGEKMGKLRMLTIVSGSTLIGPHLKAIFNAIYMY